MPLDPDPEAAASPVPILSAGSSCDAAASAAARTASDLPARPLEIRRLAGLPYGEGLVLQRALVEARRAGQSEDLLLLVEHPHVLTLGVRGDGGRSHILATAERLKSLGVDVYESGRGGDVTYHGPGQVVGYPILDLAPDRCDVHRYVRELEEVLIRVAKDFGVTASRVCGRTGVWVGDGKLAAIGVRLSRWVTSHGFAFNVTTDLDYFDLIVPCGIADAGVTSLARLGCPADRAEVERRIVARFAEVFNRQPWESTAHTPRPASSSLVL
jgi:lipoyl(octanoyl) transferase